MRLPAQVAAGAAAVALLGACSAPASDAPPASSAPVPATSSAAPGPSAPPASSSAATSGIVILPESLLRPISGLEYSDSGISDADRIAAFAEATGDTSVVEGILFRELTYQGDPVGGVEIIRFVQAPPEEVAGSFMTQLLDGFAGTEGAAAQVPGQPAWQVENTERGTGAVGWFDGADVYIVWSSSAADASTIAEEFLAGA